MNADEQDLLFHQALNEVKLTLAPFLKKHPEYQKALDIVQVPERVIQFRVVWEGESLFPFMEMKRGHNHMCEY